MNSVRAKILNFFIYYLSYRSRMVAQPPTLTTWPAWALFVLASLGASNCTVGPNYRKTEPNTPAKWNRLEATASPVADASARGDLGQWWQRLNDPVLSQLVEDAQRQSLDLRKAEARLREARARLGIATAGRYPSVGASASASRSGSVGPSVSPNAGDGATAAGAGNQFNAGFDASWELDVFGGVRRSVEAAQADQQSAVAGLDDARVSLVAEVARGYVLSKRTGLSLTYSLSTVLADRFFDLTGLLAITFLFFPKKSLIN